MDSLPGILVVCHNTHTARVGGGGLVVNRQVRLVQRPVGVPDLACFDLVTEPVGPVDPGTVLVRTQWLSVDPYMRGRMRDAKSYAPPYDLGTVIAGGAVGAVEDSGDPAFPPGTIVAGHWGWQDYVLVPTLGLRRLDPQAAPPELALGVLGMPGLTAYFGVTAVCRPHSGETVVVSGAAGAVGMAAAQIAQLLGGRVVGIAGGPTKTSYLGETLGLAAALDYKNGAESLDAALERVCPEGVDVYFDNVGGTISESVFARLNRGARMAICGQIATYNEEVAHPGPPGLFGQVLARRLRLEGFLVGDFAPKFPEGLEQLTTWWRQGRLKHRETVVYGLEAAPRAFLGLFSGENIGKMLVKVAD